MCCSPWWLEPNPLAQERGVPNCQTHCVSRAMMYMYRGMIWAQSNDNEF